MMDEELYHLAETVGRHLESGGRRLVTAESCTGGWVAKSLTDVPGSSAWFDRGYVTYTNAAKIELLGVIPDILARHGAVSEATVRAMVVGALADSGADAALAVSGIAGPSGGSPDKPVGTVWLAWGVRAGSVAARGLRFRGDRESIRRQAVMTALRGMLEL